MDIVSTLSAMFAGTSYESRTRDLLQSSEFINCVEVFATMGPATMPTTREEKDACIQGMNETFDTHPVYQTQIGLFCKAFMKPQMIELIERPNLDSALNRLTTICEEVGMGVNDRENVRNRFLTTVESITTESQPEIK